jgi:hypothetical protein
MSTTGPLGGAGAVGPGVPIINTKKCRRPPLGGAKAGDPEVPTINAKKYRRWTPWRVPELKIRECAPSTLRNNYGGPPTPVGVPVPTQGLKGAL